jgi:hypothetical protein
MSAGVLSWWVALCVIGAANVVAWGLSLAALWRRQTAMSAECYIACRRQIVLSAVYVFGCAFRSVLPVFDVPRLVLFNTWLSSVAVGRSVATVAELCFVAQWALMLRETARVTHSPVMKAISHLIVPFIAVAEICSWYSVLTTANIGHVIEESLWGISAGTVAFTLTAFYPRCPKSWRPMLLTAVIAGGAYATYMFFPAPRRFRPLGRLEGRDDLDVALLQRRRVDQHLACARRHAPAPVAG